MIRRTARHRIVRGETEAGAVNITLPEGMAVEADADRVVFAPERVNVYADDWRVRPARGLA